jgi:hypothetical protein
LEEFQNTVDNLLIRQHMYWMTSKLTKRPAGKSSVIKAVTECGCVSVKQKRTLPDIIESINELKSYLDNHLRGQYVPPCIEVVVGELVKLYLYSNRCVFPGY